MAISVSAGAIRKNGVDWLIRAQEAPIQNWVSFLVVEACHNKRKSEKESQEIGKRRSKGMLQRVHSLIT
ncbi:MAG: hypothetical protein AAF335_04545 [Bacteroidota bacterium]